jgi:hypothetical protein
VFVCVCVFVCGCVCEAVHVAKKKSGGTWCMRAAFGECKQEDRRTPLSFQVRLQYHIHC